MIQIQDGVFWLGLAFLMTHELDAMFRHEWRLLFGLRRMGDHAAAVMFVWLHVPLFWLLMWLGDHPSIGVRFWTMLIFDLFMIVHAFLHLRLRNHPLYEFEGWASNGLIWGGSGIALIHLLLLINA